MALRPAFAGSNNLESIPCLHTHIPWLRQRIAEGSITFEGSLHMMHVYNCKSCTRYNNVAYFSSKSSKCYINVAFPSKSSNCYINVAFPSKSCKCYINVAFPYKNSKCYSNIAFPYKSGKCYSNVAFPSKRSKCYSNVEFPSKSVTLHFCFQSHLYCNYFTCVHECLYHTMVCGNGVSAIVHICVYLVMVCGKETCIKSPLQVPICVYFNNSSTSIILLLVLLLSEFVTSSSCRTDLSIHFQPGRSTFI